MRTVNSVAPPGSCQSGIVILITKLSGVSQYGATTGDTGENLK